VNLVQFAVKHAPRDKVPLAHVEVDHLRALDELGPCDSHPLVLTSPIATTAALDRGQLEPNHRFFAVCGCEALKEADSSGSPIVSAVLLEGGAADALNFAATLRRDQIRAFEFVRRRLPDSSDAGLLFSDWPPFRRGLNPNQHT
jgi:hypothetical protein